MLLLWELRFWSYDFGVTILELRFWIYEIKKALHILWTSIVNRNSKILFDAIAVGVTIWELRFGIYDFGVEILDLRDQKSVAHSMDFNRKS
jgi:hypothetical protein